MRHQSDLGQYKDYHVLQIPHDQDRTVIYVDHKTESVPTLELTDSDGETNPMLAAVYLSRFSAWNVWKRIAWRCRAFTALYVVNVTCERSSDD